MKYRALTNENFYYLETKRVAMLIKKNKGISKEELFEYLKENEILEANNEKNFKSKFLTIYKRLSSLNEVLIERIAEESSDIGKFINLLSIILNEKIVFDFINEVIKKRYFLLDKVIDNIDFNKFMSEKSEEIEEVSKWTEASKKKIIVRLKTYFVESGYLMKSKFNTSEYKISRPLIPMDILKNIEIEYGEVILEAILQKQ